jgi:hypothetical protein
LVNGGDNASVNIGFISEMGGYKKKMARNELKCYWCGKEEMYLFPMGKDTICWKCRQHIRKIK